MTHAGLVREALEAAEKAIRMAQRVPKQGYVYENACTDALKKIEAANARLREPEDPTN